MTSVNCISAETVIGLLIPFLGTAAGFWNGLLFLLLLKRFFPHLHMFDEKAEELKTRLARTGLMILAVTLHNIPERIAVGIVYAGLLTAPTKITAGAALGIAIQKSPEGDIISMPSCAEGTTQARAFASGDLSGAVEPVGAILTILAASLLIPDMPYRLSFAAGAIIYVIVEELIPECHPGSTPIPLY